MLKYILFAALFAVALSAPLEQSSSGENPLSHIQKIKRNDDEQLTRPSPINPDIPSDPKPAEHLILDAEPSSTTTEESDDNRPPSIHAYEKSSSSSSESVEKRESDDAKKTVEHLQTPIPVALGEPAPAQLPKDYKRSRRETDTPKTSASIEKDNKAPVPITLGEPTIAKPPPGYKHVRRSAADDSEAIATASVTTQKDTKAPVPITLGEPTIAKPPPGYKHVRRSPNQTSKSISSAATATVAAVQPDTKTPVPITLGEPTIIQAPPGHKHVKRSTDENQETSKFETSHHIPAHVQLEQKHETIDNPAEHIEEEKRETKIEEANKKTKEEQSVSFISNVEEEKKSLSAPLENNPTIATPSILAKRETNNNDEDKIESDAIVVPSLHLEPSKEILAPQKREADGKSTQLASLPSPPASSEENRPHFVRPVPVDQIIKNSHVAPEIHASQQDDEEADDAPVEHIERASPPSFKRKKSE